MKWERRSSKKKNGIKKLRQLKDDKKSRDSRDNYNENRKKKRSIQ